MANTRENNKYSHQFIQYIVWDFFQVCMHTLKTLNYASLKISRSTLVNNTELPALHLGYYILTNYMFPKYKALSHIVWECTCFDLSSAVKGIHKATHLMLNDDPILKSFEVQILPQYYLIHSRNTTVKREFNSFSNFYHVKYPNIKVTHKL